MFIFAVDIAMWRFTTESLTAALNDAHGWVWKLKSLEVVAVGVNLPANPTVRILSGGQSLNYKMCSEWRPWVAICIQETPRAR